MFPKVTKGRVGVVIAIKTDTDSELRTLNDFILRLGELIRGNSLSKYVELVILNNYQAGVFTNIINGYLPDLERFRETGRFKKDKGHISWLRFRKKVSGHFYIWGDIRKRKDGDDKYFFNLDGLVVHRPLSVDVHKEFTKRFIEGWFRRIKYSELFEFKGFELSADLVYIAVKYIVGMAAFISGDPFFALRLHDNLSQDIRKVRSGVDDRSKTKLDLVALKARKLIGEENLVIARRYQLIGEMDKCEKYLQKSFMANSVNYSAYILRSLVEFKSGDVKASLRSINKAEKLPEARFDNTWRYNKAFIFLFLGKYKQAATQYRHIAKNTFDGELLTVSELKTFNLKMLSSENFIPSGFVLGFLEYQKEDNFPLALNYLEGFLEYASTKSDLDPLIELASLYLGDIKKQMRIEGV